MLRMPAQPFQSTRVSKARVQLLVEIIDLLLRRELDLVRLNLLDRLLVLFLLLCVELLVADI